MHYLLYTLLLVVVCASFAACDMVGWPTIEISFEAPLSEENATVRVLLILILCPLANRMPIDSLWANTMMENKTQVAMALGGSSLAVAQPE